MRCLYCGIRLKIAEKAQAIEHCPECSMRIELERRRDAVGLRAESRGEIMLADGKQARALSASMKSA